MSSFSKRSMKSIQTTEHKPFSLILSGGGGRGLAHAGVLRALEHEGFRPSAIVGVSMGAVVALTYVLNTQWYSELVTMDTSEFPKPSKQPKNDFRSRVRSLLASERNLLDMFIGWGAGERAVGYGKKLLQGLTRDGFLEAGRIPVAVIASDLQSGKRIVIRQGNAAEAAYASAALPGVLPPLRRGHQLLADGSYTDNAPVDVARSLSAGLVLAVDVSQTEEACEIHNGFQAMMRAMEICHHRHAQIRFQAADLVLKPHFPFHIDVLDFSYKQTCVAAGIQVVRQNKQTLRRKLLIPSEA